MKTLVKIAPLYFFLSLIAFLGGFFLYPYLALFLTRRLDPLPPAGEAWLLLEQQFYGDLLPADVRMRAAVRGMLETLEDPYTVLLDPQPAQQEQHRLSGRYGDIGVTLWWATDGGIGISPYPGGPAEQAGVREGDLLLHINAEAIDPSASPDALAGRLQGEIDTVVELTVRRPPTLTLTFSIPRAEVLRPSVQGRVLDASRGIGYLRLTGFTGRTVSETTEQLAYLKRSGVSALVLDLRGNGGGLVAPLQQLTGLFLPTDTLIYYETDRRTEVAVRGTGTPQFTGPLVILVDGSTASAAEIFAAALHENERAALIGQPTYGKGSIQELHALRDGSILHLTSAVWLTPHRQRLDGVGLVPDIVITLQEGQDAVLQAALEYLAQ